MTSTPTKTSVRQVKSSKRKPGWRTAATSDIHELYELSVQEPEAECDLIDQIWKEQRGRTCRYIREDFCGTAVVSMEWTKRRKKNTAVGVDIDPAVLAWGRKRMAKRLNAEQRSRVKLIKGDVRTAKMEPVDSLLAMNFSYFIFKTRDELRRYFESAYRNLTDEGLFLLDAYGGSESFSEMEEERDLDGFTYIWDQHHYNPVTGRVVNHIHFAFPDGTKIKRAFTYDWRLWTLSEIREVLHEAGFRKVWVYWEGTDEETGEGDGMWTVTTRGEACAGWIAYIAAGK